jgi:hypothetical protein
VVGADGVGLSVETGEIAGPDIDRTGAEVDCASIETVEIDDRSSVRFRSRVS